MPLQADSPLRNVPAEVPDHQALCIDGIRYSIDIADLSYSRLLDALDGLSKGPAGGDPLVRLMTAAVADAWQFVDSVNRLRDLLNALPGLRKSPGHSPYLKIFLDDTEPVDGLRNVIQHLETELPAMARGRQPAWGSISWAYQEKADEGTLFTIIPGRFPLESVVPGPHNPRGGKVKAIDDVTLNCAGKTAPLSRIYEAVAQVTLAIHGAFEPHFKGKPVAGVDYLMPLLHWRARET